MKLYFLTILLCLTIKQVFSQDTAKFSIKTFNTTEDFSAITVSWSSISIEYTYKHSPTKEDSLFYEQHKELILVEPSEKNYEDYYSLAAVLWELSRLSESENMFLRIVNSTKAFYTATYYHSSDIPGDTSANLYGYGSYTTNYKNYACCYLTKIYLEKKEFDKALKFIQLADTKYIAQYNCGTGHRLYRNEIDGLYSLCYEGLGMYDTIIEKYLPDYSNYYNAVLVRAIKKKYSPNEISNILANAEKFIVCVVDTFQSSSTTTYNYGTKNETTIESKYTSGTATIDLFGKTLTIPTPSLESGEVVTKEKFLKEFRSSGFYKALTEGYPK